MRALPGGLQGAGADEDAGRRGETAASSDAPRNMIRPIWKARLRPHRSPSLPASSSSAANVTL